MSSTTTIYVYLVGEGVDVWRAVAAESLGQSLYRILPAEDKEATEVWEFQPGDIVRCEQMSFSEGEGLVAVSKGVQSAT